MTKFCFEVPIPHLEDFHKYQDYGFALSFLCVHKEYVDYLQRFKKEGKLLILDNSFNELQRPEPTGLLAELYERIQPDLVVSPDADFWSTEELFQAYEDLCTQVPREKVMLVIRSETEYGMALKEGIKYLAIPYEFRPYVSEKVLYHPGIHFLGYLNPFEIFKYRPNTCDTTMPIKLALLNITSREWITQGCEHIPSTNLSHTLLLDPLTWDELDRAKLITQEFKDDFRSM